jgi:hypothetical protein
VSILQTDISRARPLDPLLATKYIKNSLSYNSPEMAQICAAARKANITVVLGFSENDHNSLYIAQCTISSSGAVIMKRRKFKPTHMVWVAWERSAAGSIYSPCSSTTPSACGSRSTLLRGRHCIRIPMKILGCTV